MNNWIETKDKLPDIGIPVLIRTETKWGRKSYAVAYRQADECDSYEWFDDYHNMSITNSVTHWKDFGVSDLD